MTLNVNLEDVPWKILEAVKLRIMTNRRKLQDNQQQQQRPTLQPKPQIRKFGADSRTWKRPEPAATLSNEGTGVLLVPSGVYNAQIEGYKVIAAKLPSNPFAESVSLERDGAFLVPATVDNGMGLEANAYGVYRSQSKLLPLKDFNQFTLEVLVTAASSTAPSYSPGLYNDIGFWFWEYDAWLGGDPDANPPRPPFFRENLILESTAPTGIRRPVAPSIHFAGTTTSVVAERGPFYYLPYYPEITTPPRVIETPAFFTSSTSFRLSIYDSEETLISQFFFYVAREVYGGDEGGEFVGQQQDAYDHVVYAFNAPDAENGNASITDTPESLAQLCHLAIQRSVRDNQTVIEGYLNGSLILSAPIQAEMPSEGQNGYITMEVTQTSPTDGPVVRDPGVPIPGDSWISFGNITAAAAMRQKFKGYRFTPGRALYKGESFTPPSNITRLA